MAHFPCRLPSCFWVVLIWVTLMCPFAYTQLSVAPVSGHCCCYSFGRSFALVTAVGLLQEAAKATQSSNLGCSEGFDVSDISWCSSPRNDTITWYLLWTLQQKCVISHHLSPLTAPTTFLPRPSSANAVQNLELGNEKSFTVAIWSPKCWTKCWHWDFEASGSATTPDGTGSAVSMPAEKWKGLVPWIVG